MRDCPTASAPGLAHASANQELATPGRPPLRNESSVVIGVPFNRLKLDRVRGSRLAERPELEHHSAVGKLRAANCCFQYYFYSFATVNCAG